MTDKQIQVSVEETASSRSDIIKWVLSIALLFAGFALDAYFGAQSVGLRIVIWLGVLGSIGALVSQTSQAVALIAFAKQSQVELRKVVWPTRQETLQTAMIVGLVVLVVGMALWGVDMVLLWLVGLLTGQRG